MKRDQEPTLISRIEDAFAKADDFLTVRQLAAATGIYSNTIASILSTMRVKYQAFDCVEQDKSLWWYPTPETDKRLKRVAARVPEEAGHRGGTGRYVKARVKREAK